MDYLNTVNFLDSRPLIWRIDYAGRSDGQPVYQGFANTGTSEDATDWLIYKFTYTADPGSVTQRDVSCGSWTGRVSLTYA